MKEYIVKSKFNFFNVGDKATEADYNNFGKQYFDVVEAEEKKEVTINFEINDNTKKQDDNAPDGNSEENSGNSKSENTAEETEAIDYEAKTIPQLKEIADERKIEYANNILKADLIALLK